jgi:hypothetical protein
MRLRVAFAAAAVVPAIVASFAQTHRSAAPAAAEVDVSRVAGAQVEPAIVVDPSNDQVLLAGSNSFMEGAMRVYASSDGGASWSSSFLYPAPASFLTSCASDPGVAIDATGRQYYSFIRTTPCRTGRPRLYVASRSGPTASWQAPVLVAPLRTSISDDKPAIAVDASRSSPHRGRVYAAWSLLSRNGVFSIVLSSSDDGGLTWRRPVKVNRSGREESYASVAVARNGLVYVAWDDASSYSLEIARSTNGGARFERERTVTTFSIVPIPSCGDGIVIPASLRTCLHANPIVSVDRSGGQRSGRVYVSYAQTDFGGDEGVFVKAYDSKLRTLVSTRDGAGVPVAPRPVAVRPDQFWPASAVDSSTGVLWACYYDTTGDRTRRKAFYSCTVSRSGGRTWAKPVHAASVASDETGPGADLRQYGDYEGLAVANGVAHPIWTDSRDLATLGEEIYTTALSEADLRPPAPSG